MPTETPDSMETDRPYRILESDYARGLEDSVCDAISDGWIPLGGVAYVERLDADGYLVYLYVQAVVQPLPSR